LLEELSFAEWIFRLQAAKREVMTPDGYLDAARHGIVEGLEAGITTYADTCDSGAAVTAMRELGVRGIVYQEVFGPAPEQCAPAIGDLRDRLAALRAESTDLVEVGVSPHAPFTVSDELYRAVATLARDERLPVAAHISESEAETELVRDAGGVFAAGLRSRAIPVVPRARSSVALLERTGVLATSPLLIHCVRADDADLATIAAHRCSIAHCPVSNAKLGHGIAPLARMLELGINVGLGSDSVASNNRMDLIDEARAAVLFRRVAASNGTRLDARGALELATIGGARALGLGDRIGSLEVGKAADLVAFDLTSAADVPGEDPVTALIFARAGRRARCVVVAGTVRVWDGVVRHEDLGMVERVRTLGRRLARAIRSGASGLASDASHA